jgi:hypothetical protein
LEAFVFWGDQINFKKGETMKKLLGILFSLPIIMLSYGLVYAGIDVVFKIDESGSMTDDIAAIKANVVTIFNALPAGSHVGVVGYGTPSHGGGTGQIPHIHTPVTNDPGAFQGAVNGLTATGGLEQGYRAVYESATDTVSVGGSLGFTGDPYCNILITDENPDQGGNTRDEAITAMQVFNNGKGGIFFGILPTALFAEAQPLADATGGMLFDLAAFRADPQPAIDAVLAACVEAAQPVEIDIKPNSCPNPLKMSKTGLFPVAILGTEDFDVTSVDPYSVMLEGDCHAYHVSLEDVATPYDGEVSDPPLEDECTTAEGDGYTDMTLKFASECVSMSQGAVTEPIVKLFTLTGKYVNGSGTEVDFEATDVVRVMP